MSGGISKIAAELAAKLKKVHSPSRSVICECCYDKIYRSKSDQYSWTALLKGRCIICAISLSRRDDK